LIAVNNKRDNQSVALTNYVPNSDVGSKSKFLAIQDWLPDQNLN